MNTIQKKQSTTPSESPFEPFASTEQRGREVRSQGFFPLQESWLKSDKRSEQRSSSPIGSREVTVSLKRKHEPELGSSYFHLSAEPLSRSSALNESASAQESTTLSLMPACIDMTAVASQRLSKADSSAPTAVATNIQPVKPPQSTAQNTPTEMIDLPYKCTLCTASYAQPRTLADHVISKHIKGGDISCLTCGSTKISRRQLNGQHLKNCPNMQLECELAARLKDEFISLKQFGDMLHDLGVQNIRKILFDVFNLYITFTDNKYHIAKADRDFVFKVSESFKAVKTHFNLSLKNHAFPSFDDFKVYFKCDYTAGCQKRQYSFRDAIQHLNKSHGCNLYLYPRLEPGVEGNVSTSTATSQVE